MAIRGGGTAASTPREPGRSRQVSRRGTCQCVRAGSLLREVTLRGGSGRWLERWGVVMVRCSPWGGGLVPLGSVGEFVCPSYPLKCCRSVHRREGWSRASPGPDSRPGGVRRFIRERVRDNRDDRTTARDGVRDNRDGLEGDRDRCGTGSARPASGAPGAQREPGHFRDDGAGLLPDLFPDGPVVDRDLVGGARVLGDGEGALVAEERAEQLVGDVHLDPEPLGRNASSAAA
jgi:hypothetical protein